MGYDPSDWLLYYIPEAGSQWSLARLVELSLDAGVQVIQLRLKNVNDKEWMETGQELMKICNLYRRPLMINDRPDIAKRLGSAGVHVGQADEPAASARRILGRKSIIGVSVRDEAEAARAEREGADYVAVGPIFSTPIKSETAPLGLGAVSRVREAVDIPVMAIGGINATNAQAVIKAGADGIAVISAISAAADPRVAAETLMEIIRTTLTKS